MTRGELWIKVNVNHLLFLKPSLLQAILPGGFLSLWGFQFFFFTPLSLLFSLSNFASSHHMLIAFLGADRDTRATVSISEPLISPSPHHMSCSTPPSPSDLICLPPLLFLNSSCLSTATFTPLHHSHHLVTLHKHADHRKKIPPFV